MDLHEDEVSSEGTFRYVIPNFSQLREITYGPATQIRNLPWKIMVFPRMVMGTEGRPIKGLAFFVQCNGDSDSLSWSCHAFAELRIIGQKESVKMYSRRIQHMFCSRENDWGFSYFMSWNDILNPEKGFIRDDTVILEVFVLADVPNGVAWDSKTHTGFVGLLNSGATRCMNSVLQSLFFINKLRKAVYQIPIENNDSTRRFTFALQRMFYELQYSYKPVVTKRLTSSMGGNISEFMSQHSVQELCHIFLDNVKSKMKGTCFEDSVSELFEGKIVSFIRCKEVDYVSKKVEPFYAIQLNTEGKENLMESFKAYCTIKKLEGENKFDAGQHGLQDAEKSIAFSSLPPVLHLHLLPFPYDQPGDQNVKINHRFEFPENLNLDEFLQSLEATPATYTLYAVLVHSGDVLGNHYVAFISPKVNGEWFKFEDKVVSRCSKQAAIGCNFGRQEDDIDVKYSRSAYMLVYVRDSAVGGILAPVTEADVPERLVEQLRDESQREIVHRRKRLEAQLQANQK